MSAKVREAYDLICSLNFVEKQQLYSMIADDFEAADPSLEKTAAPQVRVPRWLYRLLARWS